MSPAVLGLNVEKSFVSEIAVVIGVSEPASALVTVGAVVVVPPLAVVIKDWNAVPILAGFAPLLIAVCNLTAAAAVLASGLFVKLPTASKKVALSPL